jgi:uncharacterized protein (TIGR00255 family)
MPVYSMTGYASASSGVASAPSEASVAEAVTSSASNALPAAVTIELRSVNSRFLDLAFRIPDEFRAIESTLRELLTARFRRGKIELRLNAHRDSDSSWSPPRTEQLSKLARVESTIQSWLPKAAGLSVAEVLQLCKGGSGAARLDEAAVEATKRCIEGLVESRAREGRRLVSILMERICRLLELAKLAEPMVPALVARQQQRFLERWEEALHATAGSPSAPSAASISREALQERALNEATAYAIRIDVAEELARLRAHADEITRLLTAGGEVGKRLDFLIQELHREANTLGSKSTALELTNISVEMKVLVEQLREQVQNIE